MAEKNKPADESVATTQPATAPAATSPRFGRGILIGATAAALVVGLGAGTAGGFAIAHAIGPRHAIAQQGGGIQGPPNMQQGPGAGQPPQGGQGQQGPGQQGPGQQGPGPQGPGQNQQDQQDQNDTDTDSQDG